MATPRQLVSSWRKDHVKPGLVVEVQTQADGRLRHPDDEWDGSQKRLADVAVKTGDVLSLVMYRRFGRDDRELVDYASIRVGVDRCELLE